MLKKQNKIAVGFAESLAAIETAFNLTANGFSVFSFTRNGSTPPLRLAKNIEIFEIQAPEVDAEAACSDLQKHIKRIGAALLMPLDDVSLWISNHIRNDIPALFVGPNDKCVQLALNKKHQIDAAKKAAFLIPETIIINHRDDLLKIKNFPVILKPANAISKIDGKLKKGKTFIATDPDELNNIDYKWDKIDPYLAQSILRGTGEGIFGYSSGKDVYCISAHRRLRMMNPNGSGSSACYSIDPDKDTVNSCLKFIQNLGYAGIFMIETLRDHNGNNWFMELNGRTWGSMALAIKKGYDYPLWAVKGTIDKHFIPNRSVKDADITARHVGREIVHLLMVMRGSKHKKIFRWPSRLGTIRNVLTIKKNDRFYNFRKGNIRVFIDDTIKTVKDQIFKNR